VESLYLLIPLSLLLVLAVGGLLAWSVLRGQFDDLDAEGRRILGDDEADTNIPDGVKGDSATLRHSAQSERAPGAD
jgi:cbb3-type cytochrome oxidase maturation protein